MSSSAIAQDSFTGTGNGTTVDAGPCKSFGVDVVGVGGTPTLWTVLLEGSIDGTNFAQILQHTQVIGAGTPLWSGLALYPCRYFRSRVTALTLGLASSITVTIVGMS